MPAVDSKEHKSEETILLSISDARKLGLEPLPHVGKGKREAFQELLAKAGVKIGGPLYRGGKEKPFFFTNTTFREWLKAKGITFHPEQVFANLLWWLRGLPMSRLRYSLYLALGRKTKRGTTHQVVGFDPNAPSSVRQAYKGVWAIAGSPQVFSFLEDKFYYPVAACAAEVTLGCEHLIRSHPGGKPLCVCCLTSAVLRSCLGREGDFAVSVAELYSQLGLESEDQSPFLQVVSNRLYMTWDTLAIFSIMSEAQTRHFLFLTECLATIVSSRDPPTHERQDPIPGVPDLMGLLEDKELLPPRGLEEVARRVVQAYSTDPAVVLPHAFGWCVDQHGDIPEQIYGLNMVRCVHGCGRSADFAGGCAAIACPCRREYCRICGGSALNGPDTPDHPHCRCGQFLGRGHCYVEEGQRREAERVFQPSGMDVVVTRTPLSRLESFVRFLRRAHPGLIIPSVMPPAPPPPQQEETQPLPQDQAQSQPLPQDQAQPQPEDSPEWEQQEDPYQDVHPELPPVAAQVPQVPEVPQAFSLQAPAPRIVDGRPPDSLIEDWTAIVVEEPDPVQRERFLSAAPPRVELIVRQILEL